MKIADDYVESEALWREACLSTPLGRPHEETPEAAMRVPSCCVKSVESDGPWSAYHGVLVSYDVGRDRAVVRGHGSSVSPNFVWSGTLAEYHLLWECD